MRKLVYIATLIGILSFLAFGLDTSYVSKNKAKLKLATTTTQFVAGKPIQLTFSSSSYTPDISLFIIHSYGKTVLSSKKKKDKIFFEIPTNYTQKTGVVSWFLIQNNMGIERGKFEIIPNNRTKTKIENYLGPRSILAGGKDFTMMVSVPTDAFDNPVSDNTKVAIKNQFLNNIESETLPTENFIVWKNIYSPQKSGQIVASTACQNTATKEIETEVYPNIATDFSISYSRNHNYADGNQITTISTSIIKDQFGNMVSDGTNVLFDIITKNNLHLKTVGTTINGIASGQILHPDHPDSYQITGYITGIAKSNSIKMDYLAIINHFDYQFSNDNRQITVGPLKSFMGQLVPDGIKVSLKIFHNNHLIETLIDDTSKGIATFELPSAFYKEKEYRFEITALGITQKTKTKKYDTHQ